MTVVVCTRERPERLETCLRSLLAQEYPAFSVLVVDNAPTTDRSQSVVEELASSVIRYVVEPRMGLSWARNKALEVVGDGIIAWIDDDETADEHWLAELARGFHDHPEADAVSGVMIPAELETWAQVWFEQYGGHNKLRGFTPTVFSSDTASTQSPFYPLPPFGTGGNMAFLVSALERIGGFDVALGAGSRCMGAEDTRAFTDLLCSGGTLVYQPTAITFHFHRRSLEQLRLQMLGNGVGLTGYYTSLLLTRPGCIPDLIRLLPMVYRDLFGSKSLRSGALPANYPPELRRANRHGLLVGPFSYLLARRDAARLVGEPKERELEGDVNDALGNTGATWVGQVELADSLQVEAVIESDRVAAHWARVMVRLHHAPLGFVTIASSGGVVNIDVLRRMVWRIFKADICKHLDEDGLPRPEELPPEGLGGWDVCATGRSVDSPEHPISVVVSTKDRPESLRRVLRTLQEVQYGCFEVLVVDNAPSTEATRKCVEELAANDPRIRYLLEAHAGLSRARNAGLREARYDWVAFTDDDVLVDPWWLRGVERGIRRGEEVGCVTGLVPPASLFEPAQRYFDERISWTGSLQSRVYNLENRHDNSLYPYSAGIFGTGANFAVDRRLVELIGGFDTALGAGSLTNGGEDLDMFLRVLLAGRAIAYESSAVIWHIHRSDSDALGRQMYSYGLGLTAYLAKHMFDRSTRWQVLRQVRAVRVHMVHLMSRTGGVGQSFRRSPVHAGYIRAELRGMIAGPFAYLRARHSDRASPDSVTQGPTASS